MGLLGNLLMKCVRSKFFVTGRTPLFTPEDNDKANMHQQQFKPADDITKCNSQSHLAK